MKRYKVAAILLQIEELVYVWHVGAGDYTRTPAVGIVGPNMSLGRSLEHRLRHHALADQNHSNRAAVVVDRRALTLPPTQQQHLGVLAAYDQVSSVLVIRKESIPFVISLPDQQGREPVDDLGERGNSC
jgi:hypothetical protein